MGQGHYTQLGFGVIDPPLCGDEDAWDELWWKAEKTFPKLAYGLRQAYECEPDFLLICLAVDDEFLQDERGVPALPDDCPRVGKRQCRYVDVPSQIVSREVRQQWAWLRKEAAKFAVVLPAGKLVLAADWD